MKKHISLLTLALCATSLTQAQTIQESSVGSGSIAATSNGQIARPASALGSDGEPISPLASPGTLSHQPTKPTQEPWGKSGKFGIYAGANLARFVGEPIPDDAYRVGWQAGLYGRTGGTFFGQLGAEYRNSSVNLVRVNSNTTSSELKGNLNQHTLAIPAYVGVRAGGALGLRVQVGAEFATLLSVGNNDFSLNKDNLRTSTVNGLADLGINLGPLTLDAVYNHGFANVYKNSTLDSKRRMFGLNLGLRF